MDQNDWNSIVSNVAERMMVHCRPFMTPLSTETHQTVRLKGTGAYLGVGCCKYLLTCRHVVKTGATHNQFKGTDKVIELSNTFKLGEHLDDVALVEIKEDEWSAYQHQAKALPYERISKVHNPIMSGELLFLFGWAGENANYGFGVLNTNGSGYCTQEIKDTRTNDDFEIFWDPQKIIVCKEKPEHNIQNNFDDPSGFSGSLVWNTRYCEVTNQGNNWSPTDAVVTGILKRWDQNNKSLIVWRTERLKEWIANTIER